ncbi:glycosyltransferase [bacterium]|nr:glycosyltransferase [bacterium]
MKHYNIYFIPFEIKGPVYLELLKRHINGRAQDGSSYSANRFSWKHLLFAPYEKDERRIVHIHWETNVYGSKYFFVSLAKIAFKFPLFWLLKKIRGVKIIWTMHNLKSHDYPYPKIDSFGRALMWSLADKVLLHEKSFAKSESQKRKKDIECIPPGNYIGVYGPLWEGNKDTLREAYGLSPKSIVLLALGSVRPYKALTPLIESVIEVSERGIPVHLHIAGKATKEYGNEIRGVVGENKHITLSLQYTDDKDIPVLHGLADYSVLYYGDSALGSAAILLSLSYGVPVICRDFAVSELVIPGKNGFKFHEKSGLVDVLETLPRAVKFDKQAVMSTVADWDWKKMGEATRRAYVNLYST